MVSPVRETLGSTVGLPYSFNGPSFPLSVYSVLKFIESWVRETATLGQSSENRWHD